MSKQNKMKAKVEIKITDNNGNVQSYVAYGTLNQLVWDGFLTAERQDQYWRDTDTCDLIVKKLKGESPIEYADQLLCGKCRSKMEEDEGRWGLCINCATDAEY